MTVHILTDAIIQAQRYIRSLDGVKEAPDYPPEAPNVYPFVIGRPGTGRWQFNPDGSKRGLHTIILELHVSRNNLPTDMERVMPFVDSLPDLLMSKLLNDSKWKGTIDTFDDISYRPMFWDWGNNVKTIGVEFSVNGVKMQSAIST